MSVTALPPPSLLLLRTETTISLPTSFNFAAHASLLDTPLQQMLKAASSRAAFSPADMQFTLASAVFSAGPASEQDAQSAVLRHSLSDNGNESPSYVLCNSHDVGTALTDTVDRTVTLHASVLQLAAVAAFPSTAERPSVTLTFVSLAYLVRTCV